MTYQLEKKTWCLMYGMMCKEKNCTAPHFDKPQKFCDANIQFKDTEYFGFCELLKGHKENHRCLMFEWEGEDCLAHNADRLRGLNLIKMTAQRHL